MLADFDIIQAIKSRRSVRTYKEDRPLSTDSMDLISSHMASLSNPYGIHDIGIGIIHGNVGDNLKLGTYGTIKGATTFCALYIKDCDLDTYLAAAYEFESLILWLTAKGFGTVWLGGTFKRSSFDKAFKIPTGSKIIAVSPIGFGENPRFTERIMRKFSSADSRKAWSQLFFCNDFSSPLTESEAGEFRTPLEMVRLAPSSLNSQPWRVLKIGSELHFFLKGGKKENNFDPLKLVDMGISLCHFYSSCEYLHIYGQLIDNMPKDIELPADLHYIKTWSKTIDKHQ